MKRDTVTATRLRELLDYDPEKQAARAYDVAARHHFGEFARPNFPAGG